MKFFSLSDLAADAKRRILQKLKGTAETLSQRELHPSSEEIRQFYPLPPPPPASGKIPPGRPPRPPEPFQSPFEPTPPPRWQWSREELEQAAEQLGTDPESIRRAAEAARRASTDDSFSDAARDAARAAAEALDEWRQIEEEEDRRKQQEDEEDRVRAARKRREEEEWPEEQSIDIQGGADVNNWDDQKREDAMASVHRTPGSSNVYSFVWVSNNFSVGSAGSIGVNPKPPKNADQNGVLIVTYKLWEPGIQSTQRPDAPGATYAYSNVTKSKYLEFAGATSPDSAGVAVWDYIRVRGTISGSQHAYRLISSSGEYIPRKATAKGFKTRQMLGGRNQPFAWKRSTLPPGPLTRFGIPIPNEAAMSHARARQYARRVSMPNRGQPNRGQPNTGAP